MQKIRPLIYDIGMNNGDDTDYYLTKGYKVVGIEANPSLCKFCEERFKTNIADETLKIINCAVYNREGVSDFFVHNQYPVLSTLTPPINIEHDWTRISVTVRKASSIIKENGEPFFVKIDVELVDHIVLQDLLAQNIFPAFISAEAHLIDTYCYLVCMGYEKFKLIDGETVHVRFQNQRITLVDGQQVDFSFREHSSGPFGDDVPGPWLNKTELVTQLLKDGLGWRDIHAMRE